MTGLRLKAKFGDLVENGWASEANPTRVGFFVREFTRPRKQMNPGLTWEITDGNGKFWELKPTGDHQITVTPASPFVEPTEAVVGYVIRFGGTCRGCADENGICPSAGLPCDSTSARKAARHVIDAINYGLHHGYLPRAANKLTLASTTEEVAAPVSQPIREEQPSCLATHPEAKGGVS